MVSNATVYLPGNLPTPAGDTLQAGDQIALFTSDGTCTGAGTWSEAPLAITIYGSDTWSDFNGYEEQDALQFKVWDASDESTYTTEGTYESCTEDSLSACKDDGRYMADALYTLSGLSSTLPVELTSFEATLEEDAVVLTWHTASETNTEGFEVQHAVGEQSFSKEAFVDGHSAPGEEASYTFRVEQPAPGQHRFRLKQKDLNAQFEYSSVVEVRVPTTGTFSLEAPAPNPFTSQVSFRLTVAREQVVTVAVYDMLGRQVALLHEGSLEPGTPRQFTFRGASHSSGLYFIRVSGESFQAVRKALLVR